MRGYPRRYVVFDTETVSRKSRRPTWDREQSLRLGVAKVYDPAVMPDNRHVYARFRTPNEFQGVLDQMPLDPQPIYLFAHNLQFDMKIVDWWAGVVSGKYAFKPPEHMPGKGRYKSPMFVCDGSKVMIRFFRSDGQIFLLFDSFNWMPVPLKTVGEWIKMPKLTMPSPDDPEESWDVYCQADVDLLDRALRRIWGWLSCLSVPTWAPTPASQAMQLYRMRYGKGRIKRPPDHQDTGLDRMGYYGGFIEPYLVGRVENQTYKVDANGMYPHVMRHNLYPCEVESAGDDGGAPDTMRHHEAARTTAEVWLDSPGHSYPIKFADGTYWVRGKVHTVLCGPELKRAHDRGHVKKVGRWTRYKLDMLFDRFVDTYWRLRQRAAARDDKLIASCCKLMMNSLHGKFGQRDSEWRYKGRTGPWGFFGSGVERDVVKRTRVEARCLDGHYFTRDRSEEHKDSFVPVAAWTASYARIYMQEIIRAIGPERVLYQCVDSLILTQDGYDRLHGMGMCDTGQMGDFKTEDSFAWIDIQGPNHYDHDHGWVHSGVKHGGERISPGVYEFEEWEGGADGLFGGGDDLQYTRMKIVRPFKRYDRRFVTPHGRTNAWLIDNWGASLDDTLAQTADRWKLAGE